MAVSRTQALVLGFGVAAWLPVVAILALVPEVDYRTLGVSADNHRWRRPASCPRSPRSWCCSRSVWCGADARPSGWSWSPS
jgi:hypothetical protein